MKGFTLHEILIAMVIMVVSATMATPHLHSFIQTQKVVHYTNHVVGLIRLARSEAITHGKSLLCDGNHPCDSFDTTRQLVLYRSRENTDTREEVVQLLLPEELTLRWSRFRGDALIFHRNGIMHYQNGHFLICNRHAARKIVMNWAGRTRVEKASPDSECA